MGSEEHAAVTVARRRAALRFGARRTRPEAWNLRFASIGARVPAAMVVESPALLRAAVEEVCWQVAVADRLAARPRRWRRRAYAAWAAQLRELEWRREQLRRLVEAEVLSC
jgi:predicted DCC family thiol-disulfide oxidoreductase YuxK